MNRYRAIVFALPLAVAIGTAAVTAAPALAAKPTPAPARAPARDQAAAGWLARQFTDRSHLITVFNGSKFPNQGGTIDAIFAFAATHSASDYAARAIAWLQKPGNLTGYIGDAKNGFFAGATAKAALAAEVSGISPKNFGKTDLLARLASLLTKSGRYSDQSSFGDFSNAFSQSLAILALSRHGGAPKIAIRFLIASECEDGGFPLDFAQKTCVSDPDSTAMDVQALLSVGRTVAAGRGLRWLAKAQRSDGGFATSAKAAPNANSTGLAGEALAAGGWTHRAALASKFLLALQLGCSAPASRRGAIAFDATGFKPSTAVGATAQGILGIADVPLWKLSSRGAKSGAPRLGCAS
jgi:hypothetical protein